MVFPRPTCKPHSVRQWGKVYTNLEEFLPPTGFFPCPLPGRSSVWDVPLDPSRAAYPGLIKVRAVPRPCLALLPLGVARPRALLPRRWSLTPPFHPYGPCLHGFRGLFLWPDPGDCSPPDVIRHRALWSADFPLINMN